MPWEPRASNTYWDKSLFLSITLGFGHFNFAEAKAIDIGWDLVVGRGGQLLITLMVYPVVRESLLLCLERTEVPLDTFTSLSFSNISLQSAAMLARDLFRTRKRFMPAAKRSDNEPRRSSKGRACLAAIARCWKKVTSWNWRFLGLVVASTYVLLFPTVLSAMTGYQAISQAYVKTPGDLSLVATSELQHVGIIVHDGSRIGLSSPAGLSDPSLEDPISAEIVNCMSTQSLFQAVDTDIGVL